jgi:hypothetical protein
MKTGPKLDNGVGMARLSGRPWVSPDVNVIISAWRTNYGVPAGRSITAALRFASSHPDFKLPTEGKKQ